MGTPAAELERHNEEEIYRSQQIKQRLAFLSVAARHHDIQHRTQVLDPNVLAAIFAFAILMVRRIVYVPPVMLDPYALGLTKVHRSGSLQSLHRVVGEETRNYSASFTFHDDLITCVVAVLSRSYRIGVLSLSSARGTSYTKLDLDEGGRLLLSSSTSIALEKFYAAAMDDDQKHQVMQ